MNVVSVFLLKDHHSHGHHHHHDEHHGHSHEEHHDHNLRAAYFHVMADALTSILAIAALLMGKYLGLNWLDPIMGIVGALIISKWAWGLLTQTSPILLDKSIEIDYQKQVVDCIEQQADHQVSDIHIWSISADHYAATISIVSHNPFSTEYYRDLLTPFDRLAHLTIEVNECTQLECLKNE